MIISCENLRISFNNKIIISNFSVTLLENSIIHIRGKNGSGKTSLLKILAGIYKPTSGIITLDGVPASKYIENNIKYCAYLGHNTTLKQYLTVRENLRIWANINNNHEMISAILAYFKLLEIIDIPCYMLSAGWQKRVSLCKMLLFNTNIWLLDEPETNLDKEGEESFYNLIISKANQNGTIIIASHSKLDIKNCILIDL